MVLGHEFVINKSVSNESIPCCLIRSREREREGDGFPSRIIDPSCPASCWLVVVEVGLSLIDGEFGEEKEVTEVGEQKGEERRHIDFIAFACTGSYLVLVGEGKSCVR